MPCTPQFGVGAGSTRSTGCTGATWRRVVVRDDLTAEPPAHCRLVSGHDPVRTWPLRLYRPKRKFSPGETRATFPPEPTRSKSARRFAAVKVGRTAARIAGLLDGRECVRAKMNNEGKKLASNVARQTQMLLDRADTHKQVINLFGESCDVANCLFESAETAMNGGDFRCQILKISFDLIEALIDGIKALVHALEFVHHDAT